MMPDRSYGWRARSAAAWLMKAPIHLYRVTLKPLIGQECRHLPTCSEYALEAIDRNGAWRGGWLTLSRLSRCRPGGSHGYDPVPDVRDARQGLRPWRYGRWRSASPNVQVTGDDALTDDTSARSS